MFGTPRILLASKSRLYTAGLGNGTGMVGRYFMNQIHVDPSSTAGTRPTRCRISSSSTAARFIRRFARSPVRRLYHSSIA
jgi:hypothetical protein